MWKDFLTPEEVLAGNTQRKDFEDKRKQAAEKVTGLLFLAHRVFYLLFVNSIFQLY